MISKMVILGFNGENVNPNDEIYKNIKSGLGGVILFDKDPNDKSKVKNEKQRATKRLTSITSYFKPKVINFYWPRGWNSSKIKKKKKKRRWFCGYFKS